MSLQSAAARPTAASPSMPCTRCEVRNRAVCAALAPHELERLNAIVVEARLEPGQPVFYEGDPADYVFNVTRGVIRLSKTLPDGRRQVTGFAFPADFLGFAFRDAYGFTAEAITAATLCRFPRRKLIALFDEFPQLERRLLAVASNELEAAQEQMLLLGRKSARERLASFLLTMSRRAEERGEPASPVELPMGRPDIADFLGLTTETVSRTFTRLTRDGLIEPLSPTLQHLPDREALAEIAEGGAEE